MGSAQHLKAKYGNGYSAEIKLSGPTLDALASAKQAIHSLSELSDLTDDAVTVDKLKWLCDKLGKSHRTDELSDSGSGESLLEV